MPEILYKLTPDRDLQCYFEQPSAIAAMSDAGPNGFTVSGCWRQQFDWCVIEWNRDNRFEHPAFRNLPDGDLSGLQLTYEEARENCMPIDCDLFPTVDWPYLRVWVEGQADPYKVALLPLATPVEGAYAAATAQLELAGAPTAGDYVGVSWLDEQYNHLVGGADTLESIVQAIVNAVNVFSPTMRAARDGGRITLTAKTAGANWNRMGVYGFVAGARTEQWTPWWTVFGGGASPAKWRVAIDFAALTDVNGAPVPASAVRKLRWTYAADFQRGAFARSEFAVRVSNWTVTGTGRGYTLAGLRSRRIEDESPEIIYSGEWRRWQGNYSGNSLHATNETGAKLACEYRAAAAHALYIGALRADGAGQIEARVDGGSPQSFDLRIPGEETSARVCLGEFGEGVHNVEIALTGGGYLYFDFLEVVIPASTTPAFAADGRFALATDWDTEHSLAIAPERTAWMIAELGFHGRVNHYTGAMWFYELTRKGHAYASATVAFEGTPEFGARTEITVGQAGDPASNVVLAHLHRIGDTAETVAKALELQLNRGYMSVRAEAAGPLLTIAARAMGAAGNNVTVAVSITGSGFTATASGPQLTGGTDGGWVTDLAAAPRLNRAARDWHRAFFAALKARGLDAAAAFSLELRHGDASPEAGIAQRCPAGDPVILNTPALQTNFSPASRAYWAQVYIEMAQTMAAGGLAPYVQFGEVQWWYFRDNRSGMPYYDEYTRTEFAARHGREPAIITDENASPAEHPEEAAFLAALIGEFTSAIQQTVEAAVPGCRFEVLYPLDVNEGAWNRAVNYPAAAWTPAALDCLKTESFGFTYGRDLDKCLMSIREPAARGFAPHQSAHLIGLSDARAPWREEAALARAEGVESIVLFALDQFCLIGYAPMRLVRRGMSRFNGG